MGWYRWHGLVWVAWTGMVLWVARGYSNGVKWYQTSPLYSVVDRMNPSRLNQRAVLNSTKGEAATRSRLRPSSPTHRLFPHDYVLQLEQSFHFITSYHTLSFTLCHSSLHSTKESPFTFRRAARAAATAVVTTAATATAAAAATITTTASRPEIEVIQPGLALFFGTAIFQKGTSD
jgi:hypothetical protein